MIKKLFIMLLNASMLAQGTNLLVVANEFEPLEEVETTSSGIEMYRLYNPISGEHFYTQNIQEKDNLVGIGWKYEGIGWYAPSSSNTPVYRLYNKNAQDHHYTTDQIEKETLVQLGWNDEGIGWYSDDSKTISLHRVYNPNTKKAGSHHYTSDQNERNSLVSQGWKDEGVAWYALKEGQLIAPDPTPTESLNLNLAYLSSTGTEGWAEILRIDENNHFKSSYSAVGRTQIDYYSCSGDIVDIQKIEDKKYTGKLVNIKREAPDPAWLNNGSTTKKVEINNFTLKEGDLVTIYLQDFPLNKMSSQDKAWISWLGYKKVPGTYIVNSRTKHGYCSWMTDQDSPAPSQGSQTPTDSFIGKYKVNYIMKVRSQPNYEADQIGRKEEGSTIEVVKSVSGSNNSVWGQLTTGGWICLQDTNLVYATKIR